MKVLTLPSHSKSQMPYPDLPVNPKTMSLAPLSPIRLGRLVSLGLLLCLPACSGDETSSPYGALDTTSTGGAGDCPSGCGPGQSCQAGACICQGGLIDCNGACVDTNSNGAHCGSCNNACSGQVCSNGACQDSCAAGQTACDASCVDLTTNPLHCGQCNAACAGNQTCNGGCVCQAGTSDCSGACVDLQTSALNCGACGVACGAGEACSAGQCQTSNGVTSAAATTGATVAGATVTSGSSTTSSATSAATTSGSGGATSAGSVSSTSAGGGTGISINGTCFPVCVSAASDPDGDGWGWENEASCVVMDSTPYQGGSPCDAGTSATLTTSSTVTTSTSTTSTTGGGDDCSVSPINPNANSAARNLLCYLYSIAGTQVLSGQQETSWDDPEGDISFYTSRFGDAPAVLGGDYLYPDGTTQRAIAYWNAGGIPLIRYHMGAPPRSDTYENSQATSNIDNVLTPGTAEYTSFMGKLDYVAAELQDLEDAGAAVLWAPFHETQPDGWFWWSKGSGNQLIEMWTLMYEYFTNTKGLDNLVWLFPFSGSPNAQYYPGNSLADIAGPDTYETNQPFSSLFNTTENIVGSGRPIPLHETGTIVDPTDMFNNNAAPWVLFSVWAGYQETENSVSDIQNTYEHPATITRSEVPDLN